ESEAVGVAISSDANLCFALPHALAQGLKKMVVRFGCMPAEQYVPIVMHGCDFNPSFAQQRVRVAASCAPKRIEHHAQSRFFNGSQINGFPQTRKIGWFYVKVLNRSLVPVARCTFFGDLRFNLL